MFTQDVCDTLDTLCNGGEPFYINCEYSPGPIQLYFIQSRNEARLRIFMNFAYAIHNLAEVGMGCVYFLLKDQYFLSQMQARVKTVTRQM